MHQLRFYIKEKSNIFSLEHIQNKIPAITSEIHLLKYHFERKFQAKVYPCDHKFKDKKNN